MPVKKLKDFLDTNHIKYVSITHSQAYTAQEVAASAHIPGREMAKVVIVELAGELAMAVLQANRRVILQDLREIIGSDQVSFAPEAKFQNRFPDCEIGAMPPFGNLFNLRVIADPTLFENERIVFNAGDRRFSVAMRAEDYKKIVQPELVEIV